MKHVFSLILVWGILTFNQLFAQNVGIGESNPGSKLSVKGGLSLGTNYSELTAPTGGIIIEGVLGIGTSSPDSNAVLDIASSSKGIKFPKLTQAQRSAIHNPSKGLMLFDTDSNNVYYSDGSSWQSMVNLSQVTSMISGLTSTVNGLLGGSTVSLWYTGSAAPTLLTSGNTGDYYLATSTGNYYKKTTSVSWTLQGNLMGATGAAGATGAKGATGSNGAAGAVGATGVAGAPGALGATGAKGATGATGAQGIQGVTGAAGSNGAVGATGAQGPQGIQGLTGAAGTNGTNGSNGAVGATGGSSQWSAGNGNIGNGVGSVGDWYLRLTTGDIYQKTGNLTWTEQMNIMGPTGSAGAAGAVGAKGATGATGALSSGAVAGNTPYWNGTSWIVNSSNIYNNGGNVGIGNSSPAYDLDVTGTGRYTGALTVGAYTLPATDGTSGYVLTTNGSGAVSWAAASGGGSGWALTGNSATSSNFIGTSNSQALQFKVNSVIAGYLGAADNNTFFGNSLVYTGGTSNVGIGYKATVYGTISNSIAIGTSSQIQPGNGSSDDIAIGNGANVTGGSAYSYSTAIGSSAQAQSSNAIVIGHSANTNQHYTIAIGEAAQAQGASSVVIGQSAATNSSNTVSIGYSANAQGANAIVIGQNSYSNSIGAIAIGSGSSATQAQGQYAISLGYQAYTNSLNAIAIGYAAQAQGTNTIVIGTGIYNGNSNTVAIGNSSITSVNLSGATSTSNAFTVGNSSSNGNGAYLTKGGVWTNASDRNLKEDFTTLNNAEILEKISQLKVTRWRYKGTDEYHIGPMAQDFYGLFNVGNDNKRISTIDPSGVALAAIKALNDKVADQQKTIEQLMEMLKKLKTN